MAHAQPDAILLIGSGDRLYREYVCASIARTHRLVLLASTPASWQRPYVVDAVEACLDDDDAVHAAARACHARHGLRGVLTYDETRVVLAAEVAERLGIAHLDPAAAARCRDKLATRRVLEQAGVGSAAARHVATLAQARAAAEQLGYPVVLKPRALAGSIGVTLVGGPDELAAAFELGRDARLDGVATLAGLLVEEYLDGPEISVDCAVLDGMPQIATIARKRLGFPPYFEEVGHVVVADDPTLPRAAIERVVVAAHRALGIDRGVTHTELRLTATGPRVVEVNARLGGDLIPYLGHLATGVDVAAAAADVAVGRAPRLQPTRARVAAIRFLYPTSDVCVRGLGVADGWQAPAWLERLRWEVAPGDVLRLPPDGFISRLGHAIVTGDSEAECEARLDEVERHLRIDVQRLERGDTIPAPGGARPAARWHDSRPPVGAVRHVFDSGEWLRAWEQSDAERCVARRYLLPDATAAGAAVAPFYLLERSPMWGSYEADAGVGPVWPGPVAMTPSLYAFYGPNEASPAHARTILDEGLEQARRWGATALVVGNLEPDAARAWSALAPPTVATVLDRAYRADVGDGVDGHLARLDGRVRREFRRQWRRACERGLRLEALPGAAMLPRLAAVDVLADDTSRRHGPSLYTLGTFAALSDVPGATLLVADLDGEVAGAFLTFLHGDSLYLWACGYDFERRAELGTYSFLLYESIRFAAEQGRRFVEAGRGNFRFKERHGFTPTDLWSLVYVLPGAHADELRGRLLEMDRGLRAFMSPGTQLVAPGAGR